MPWYEIREATLETNRMIAEKGDTGALISRGGPHCALGTIYYPDGQGILLYIKSSLSGDESDYVINYKSCYTNFPHETTGDQFFSEEQFEAYRNLGFHATQGFFSDRDEVAAITATTVFAAGEVEGAVHAGKAPMPESKDLKSRVQKELLKYYRPEATLANEKPTVWRTLCTLVALQEGSIAPHVRCLDPGSLLGFQLRVTSAEFLTLSAMGVPHGSL